MRIHKEPTINTYRRLCLAVITLLWLQPSQATLIDLGDLTLDTQTGFEWLDLPLNRGISYDGMLASNLNGYGEAGFRYATIDEVLGLWNHAGIPVLPGFNDSVRDLSNSAPMFDLLQLVGQTSTSSTNPYTLGLTSDLDDPWVFTAWFNYANGQATTAFSILPSTQNFTFSSWLVRDSSISQPIPEPDSLTLFGLALLLLVLWYRVTLRRQLLQTPC